MTQQLFHSNVFFNKVRGLNLYSKGDFPNSCKTILIAID